MNAVRLELRSPLRIQGISDYIVSYNHLKVKITLNPPKIHYNKMQSSLRRVTVAF